MESVTSYDLELKKIQLNYDELKELKYFDDNFINTLVDSKDAELLHKIIEKLDSISKRCKKKRITFNKKESV